MQCSFLAGGLNSGPNVDVSTSDRLFLTVAPLHSAVVTELERAGIDPDRFADDFEGELRYLLFLRGQEEARDSASATVRVDVNVRRLIPGSGNTGTFGIFGLTADRGGDPETVEWDWAVRARENVPDVYLERHLPRAAAVEVLERLQPSPPLRHSTDLDHPPPLIMFQ